MFLEKYCCKAFRASHVTVMVAVATNDPSATKTGRLLNEDSLNKCLRILLGLIIFGHSNVRVIVPQFSYNKLSF